MSEMVERVAMAIAFSRVTGPKSRWPEYWAGLQDERKSYLLTARAAIEAMREPTETLCDAAAVADPQSIRELWQAMIDAALGKSHDH